MFAKRVPVLVYGQLSKEIDSHEGYTLVGIPGHLHHKTLEDTLIKVMIRDNSVCNLSS